jgi:hypothetical protein
VNSRTKAGRQVGEGISEASDSGNGFALLAVQAGGKILLTFKFDGPANQFLIDHKFRGPHVGAMKLTGIFLALLGISALHIESARAEIISADRRIDWSTVGVEGGIPTYPQWCDATVDIPGTNLRAVGDGTTDSTAAIQFALDHCPLGQAVYLPAGTFKVTATVGNAGLRIQRGVVLRGHVNPATGLADTILTTSAPVTYIVGIGKSSDVSGVMYFPDFGGTGPLDRYGPVTDITADAPKGANSVTVSDTTNFPVGKIVRIDQRNSPTAPYAIGSLVSILGQQNGLTTWVSREGGTRALGQLAKVTARTTTSGPGKLTFYPPLFYGRDYSGGYAPQVTTTKLIDFVVGGGVENVKLNWTYGNHLGAWPLQIVGAYNCWATNVEITPCDNGYIYLESSFHCEVRHCYMHDPGTAGVGQAYGIRGGAGDSCCLVTDNMIVGTSSGIMWIEGSSGNVAAYNYVRAGTAGVLGGNLWGEYYGSHGGHGMMNLWEGNIGERFSADDLMGTSSHNTLFRNWLLGDPYPSSNLGEVWCIDIESHQVYYNIIGNILGNTGTKWTYKGAYPSPVSWRVPLIYRFGYAAPNGTPGASSNSTDSEETAFVHGNYDYATRSQIWDPATPDRTLPTSLFLKSKPSWWDNGHWPAIGPDVDIMLPSNPAARRAVALGIANFDSPSGVVDRQSPFPPRVTGKTR